MQIILHMKSNFNSDVCTAEEAFDPKDIILKSIENNRRHNIELNAQYRYGNQRIT